MMLALQNEIQRPQLLEILADPRTKRLIDVLTRFAQLLERCDYNVRVFSESALLKLNETPAEKITAIQAYYENCCHWLQGELEKPEGRENLEMRCLQRALDHYGMNADDEFWKTVEKDQIVELYGEDMVQLYRSLNFYNITGYSLLDVSVFEWYVLWSRPKQAMEMMGKHVDEVQTKYVPVERVKIPRHVIREIHNSSLTETFVPRAQLAEFLYIGTLKSCRDGSDSAVQRGFILSSRGEVIAVGEEASTIEFI